MEHSGERKRGRPVGKGRLPLSKDEKRERNARYERERRVATTDAIRELADALDVDSSTSNSDILAAARATIETAETIAEELKKRRSKILLLQEEIDKLEREVGSSSAESTEPDVEVHDFFNLGDSEEVVSVESLLHTDFEPLQFEHTTTEQFVDIISTYISSSNR